MMTNVLLNIIDRRQNMVFNASSVQVTYVTAWPDPPPIANRITTGSHILRAGQVTVSTNSSLFLALGLFRFGSIFPMSTNLYLERELLSALNHKASSLGFLIQQVLLNFPQSIVTARNGK